MFEERKYYSRESGESFTESELKAFYDEAVKSGCWEDSFCEWLNGCMEVLRQLSELVLL